MLQVISDKESLVLKRKTMREYLRMKENEEDWHGVMDAVADLREIDVMIKYIDEKQKWQDAQSKVASGLRLGQQQPNPLKVGDNK